MANRLGVSGGHHVKWRAAPPRLGPAAGSALAAAHVL